MGETSLIESAQELAWKHVNESDVNESNLTRTTFKQSCDPWMHVESSIVEME